MTGTDELKSGLQCKLNKIIAHKPQTARLKDLQSFVVDRFSFSALICAAGRTTADLHPITVKVPAIWVQLFLKALLIINIMLDSHHSEIISAFFTAQSQSELQNASEMCCKHKCRLFKSSQGDECGKRHFFSERSLCCFLFCVNILQHLKHKIHED